MDGAGGCPNVHGVPQFAQVEPLTTTRKLSGPFDYRLPASFADVAVGELLLVPFAGRRLLAVVTGVADTTEVPEQKLAEPIEKLPLSVPDDLVELGIWVGEEYCSTRARGLALVLPPGVGTGSVTRARVKAKTALFAQLTDEGRAAAGNGAASEKQRQVLSLLSHADEWLPVAALVAEVGSDSGAVRRLEKRGWVAVESRRVRRKPANEIVGALLKGAPVLNGDQVAAADEIITRLQDLASGGTVQASYLLHGVTGSGKTEIYLTAAARALELGFSVIVLVPEIALTPQTVARFEARFGDQIAVLHSKLSQGERFDEWSRLRSGEAKICVGPRSAVFAPLENVGLIIVDEEHDSSYKQDGDPRYDARDVADRRARATGAVLVAGTATPRPESWQRYPHINLPSRVDGQAMPEVELVDMRNERHALHPSTGAALARVAARGEKAIILLNRRGWSNFLACRSCGHVWQCPRCDVALVLHMASGTISCHHCGHREPVPDRCGVCGSLSVARHGTGTEKLELDLREALGRTNFEIFRLDTDAVAGGAKVGQLLRRFQDAPAGVLVGTQMVAKGHDFPDVTLGVVLDADATLRFPDFRSEERTFALVAQLAGRSGRGKAGGRVIVQTNTPEARSLIFAAQHDAAGFLADELDRRQAFSYPPFSHLVRVVCASEDAVSATAAAASLAKRLASARASLLGPAPLFKLKGRHRQQLLLKTADRHATVPLIRGAVDAAARDRQFSDVAFSVDVDPQ